MRALRKSGMVPAVIYGLDKPKSITCSARSLTNLMQDEAVFPKLSPLVWKAKHGRPFCAMFSVILASGDFACGFSRNQRRPRNINRRAVAFCRCGIGAGVKLNHGIFNAIENQIAVHCLPKNLPEFIEADVSHLQIGGSIHLGEIAPPSGVRFDEIVRGNDPALAVISEAAAAVEEEVKQEEAAPAESETATNADTTAT